MVVPAILCFAPLSIVTAIKLRWVFSYKLRPDGHIERYKARLVAKGFTQKGGIDYFEVWAPSGRLAAYCALLAHAANSGFPVKLLNFKTAFLNGELDEEIYVIQPPVFDDACVVYSSRSV